MSNINTQVANPILARLASTQELRFPSATDIVPSRSRSPAEAWVEHFVSQWKLASSEGAVLAEVEGLAGQIFAVVGVAPTGDNKVLFKCRDNKGDEARVELPIDRIVCQLRFLDEAIGTRSPIGYLISDQT